MSEEVSKLRSDKTVQDQLIEKIEQLEKRVNELEREKRLSFPVDAFGNVGAVGIWDNLKTAARTHNPFHLSTATI